MSVLAFSAMAEQSKRESVEALLTLTNADAIVDSIYAQMDQMFAGMSTQLGIKPSEQSAFDRYMKKVVVAMREDMSWEKMKDPMIDIYLKHYTEQEIQDMLAFYQTATGQSMITKMPAVMSDSMAISQAMVKDFLPKITAMAQEFRKELEEARTKD